MILDIVQFFDGLSSSVAVDCCPVTVASHNYGVSIVNLLYCRDLFVRDPVRSREASPSSHGLVTRILHYLA